MLITSLNAFATRMNKRYPYMNRGGCCVFAVHMAKRLEKVVPTRIRMADYWEENITEKREQIPVEKRTNIQFWYNKGFGFVHLVVEFDLDGKTYHYDTNGVRPAATEWNGYPFAVGHFSIEEASGFASNPAGWNTQFRRSQIPAVKRQVKNLFARHLNHYYVTKSIPLHNTNKVKSLLSTR